MNGPILIDMSCSASESVALSGTEVGRSAGLVISPYGTTSGNRVNINDVLVRQEFWEDRFAHAGRLDSLLAERAALSPALATIIVGCKVALWDHNLLEVHKWLATLNQVFAGHSVENATVLLPRACSVNEVYLYEAEGEASASSISRLLYRRTDFLLDAVRQWFQDRGATDLRTYRIRRDVVGQRLRARIRVWVVLIGSLVSHTAWLLIHRAS
jgi:hypothetical protein